MALIPCYQCDRPISDSTPACPGCGAPQPDPQAGGCLQATFGCLIGMGWLIAGLTALALLVMATLFAFAVIL